MNKSKHISNFAFHISHVSSRLRQGAAGFEDGTLAFAAIAALRHGFATMERFGGMHAIQQRCQAIRRYVCM